jgi:PAS domain S-box-containing protein
MKRTGSHTPIEKEYIRKDGTRVPVLVGTAYLGGPQNTGVGFALDLTELKRAKASLRQLTKQVQEQANTLDAILSASVDHIYIIDCAGRYKYVSAGGAQVLGFKAIDVIGKTWRDLGLPSDIMQALDEQREKVISTGQPLKREVDFSTPSGVRHYEYIIAPFYKDKSVEGIVVISRDTTERKQTETALQESEERFRTLVEQSPFSTQILAPDGQTIQVNRAWEKLWGLTLDQLPEYNMLLDQQLVDKGVMPYIKKGFAGECLEIPAIVYDPEVTIPDRSIHKDPQRWVRGFIYPVKDRDGSIREVVVVHEDISARKRAEEALALSEAKFRRLVDSNIIGVIIADYTGNIIEANDAFLQMLGYTRPELVAGNIDWRAMTPLEYLPQDLRAIEEFKQTGACAPFEKEYIHSDGSRVPVLVGGAALEGLPDTTICFVLDLSSRKQAESKLKESEERFRLLAEKVRIIPWQADARSGNFTYVGPQTVEILGYPLEEWYTDNFWGDRMHPQDREWAIKYCVDCSATLDNYEFEYRMLSADGKSVWLYDIVNVVRDENGPQILRGFMIDITHRKQAEEALQKREDELRLITNAVPVLISYVDSKQQYRFNNKLYEQWYGFPASSAYGKHIKEVIGESAYLTIRPQIEAVLSGQEVTFESKLPLQDAGNRYIRATYVPQFGEQGEVEGFVALISDISARKQAEEALQETNQALQALIVREQAARESAEAANRMKDEFLATLSHELRTPLNPIQGWIHLLRTRKFDSAATARALETIDRNTKLLTQLIEDVLDVSRIITGKLRLNVSPIELVPVIQAAIDTVQPAADAKEIRIESILDFSAGKVLGDTNRLQQVIWNLLSNAVKFTPKGGRVEVQLSIDSLYVQIRVSDTGKGISTEFLPYVFERFRQADASITRAYGGLGLGLAIVRHLVELHGGTVCAQSPGEGQGATFVVNLPLLEMRRVGEEEIGKVAASPSHLLTPASTHPLDGLRVLVVDDEADARELLVAILAEDGAEVIAVASAAEAIDALQRLQPNILVSDIGMPGEDGYTLMRKVRALDAEQGGQIPAVALTAYARASDRTEALNAGFQLHVPKPVNAAELALALAKLAGRTGNLTR